MLFLEWQRIAAATAAATAVMTTFVLRVSYRAQIIGVFSESVVFYCTAQTSLTLIFLY